ncbi:signal recognition particle subunit, partial [Dispira parvispora]
MDYKGKQPYTTTIEEVDDDTIDELDFRLPNVEAVVPHSMPQSERVKYVTDDTAFKSWVCLYPAYFDKSRSVQQGRRVMKALAVDRPRARQIAEAASSLELQILYEPDKIYPRDLLNPGRVKVQLRLENGQLA